jgi:hypothetical protein
MAADRELEQYRRLMEPPTQFADGFNLKSVIGCIFIGMVMMPASMYLGLLAGGDLSGAARWVTVILFVELARRSFTTLKRPEIYILFYMAGAAIASPFSGLLWTQYYVQSEPARAFGVAEHIPWWVAPKPDVLALRTFFHKDWLAPILLIIGGNLIGRIDNFGLGYVLYRVTSDAEKLPFPMAPVGAMGITALAENSSGEATWRWRVFSIGGMIGLLFGFIFVGVPALSGTILKQPIQILPLTFVDLTTNTEGVMPAVPMALSLDIGNILIGMVLPFFAVMGSFVGMVVTWIVNPILYHQGQLRQWQPGMNAIETQFANYMDAYLAIGIGLSLAIAIIGFTQVFRGLLNARSRVTLSPADIQPDTPSVRADGRPDTFLNRLLHPPADRGDIPLLIGLGIYLFSTCSYIAAAHWLVPNFPLWILLGYGFVYTPIVSYVACRMEGIAGQWVDIPMVREATFILSQKFGGYSGVGIWFAPLPLNNYAGSALGFRTMELTGTRFRSVIKAEMVIFPVVVISSILFSQYLWSIAPIPSVVYPYANQFWELSAKTLAVTHSSTLGGNSPFYEALKWPYIAGATSAGLVVYSCLAWAGAPVMFSYGLVRGLGGGLAAGMFPQVLGAFLGKYYFEKRFGLQWRQYAPVLLAGFSCGMGLVSMFSLGCVLVSKAVFQLPY